MSNRGSAGDLLVPWWRSQKSAWIHGAPRKGAPPATRRRGRLGFEGLVRLQSRSREHRTRALDHRSDLEIFNRSSRGCDILDSAALGYPPDAHTVPRGRCLPAFIVTDASERVASVSDSGSIASPGTCIPAGVFIRGGTHYTDTLSSWWSIGLRGGNLCYNLRHDKPYGSLPAFCKTPPPPPGQYSLSHRPYWCILSPRSYPFLWEQAPGIDLHLCRQGCAALQRTSDDHRRQLGGWCQTGDTRETS